jgi:hypothetical protein
MEGKMYVMFTGGYAIKFFGVLCVACLVQAMTFGQVHPCDSVYSAVDKMPVYGEGDNDLLLFLSGRVHFSEECRPEARLTLLFVIDKSGNVANFDIAGLKDFCKDDALRMMDDMPPWKPGILNREPVCAKVVIPMYVCYK